MQSDIMVIHGPRMILIFG